METNPADSRLLAAAKALLLLQLDSNLRNVDRKALGYAIAELREAVQTHGQISAPGAAQRVPSVESVWTHLSGD